MSVEPPVGFDALLELIWAGESRRKSPGRLTGAAVAVAVPTPVAGAADWAEMTGSERRAGAE